MENEFYFSKEDLNYIIRRCPEILDHPLDCYRKQIKLFNSVFGISTEEALQMFFDYPKCFFVSEYEMKKLKNLIKNFFFLSDIELEIKELILNTSFMLVIGASRIEEYFFYMLQNEFKASEILRILKTYPFFLYGRPGTSDFITFFKCKLGLVIFIWLAKFYI